jgi:hypothetical protein
MLRGTTRRTRLHKPSAPLVKGIKGKIEDYAKRARNETEVAYFDESYLGLVAAAAALRNEQRFSCVDTIVTLAHGIAGWNHGSVHAKYSSTLIEQLNDADFRARFISAIRHVEFIFHYSKKPSDEGFYGAMLKAVNLAQEALGVKSGKSSTSSYVALSLSTKLLHFLSPRYIPIFDQRVRNSLRISTSSLANYMALADALQQLKFWQSACPKTKLKKYWSLARRGISPLRVLDCTLYLNGKNGRKRKKSSKKEPGRSKRVVRKK